MDFRLPGFSPGKKKPSDRRADTLHPGKKISAFFLKMKDRTIFQVLNVSVLGLALLLTAWGLGAQSSAKHGWNSPSEVVKKVRKTFSEIKSYKADFVIQTESNKKTRSMKGVCYYKKGGKIRYEFSDPAGDEIVSDGKTLWIFIKRLNAVGKQDLTLNKSNKSGPIFASVTEEGLSRIFRKYHYKFDSIEQPQISPKDNRKYFVLALEQREKIGGYETMTLYVDEENFLIKRAVASDGRGKTTTVEFSGWDRNADVEDGQFNFRPDGNAKIVNNPLVSEE
ncbi:outer membrane lipoprotein carrier protein LolA [Leptospira broomii serovar Hurstbridge str. 5399]|uniref:Outer membrane lipoprotein carrier protein LolA n=2 Tax=Leptospira broomii TaxID=301541 RepID=T0F6D7_9LEPT|nr:outer membrane lipoprotein carrier protein LolA [Leptospira broomii serovar Hurstbridge str. 5399]